MTITERNMDLFDVSEDYVMAHCISAGYVLGKGIAAQFEEKYNMSEKLRKEYPVRAVGMALKIDNVYNLVTKEHHYNKPKLIDLQMALNDMKWQMLHDNEKHLAMPRIGCGLDKLNWEDVKPMIERTFKDTDIDILICIK